MTDPAQSADVRLVHAGTSRAPGYPVVAPPMLTSILISPGEPVPGDYGRGGNETWTTLEEALGAIEDAEAVVFSSGQAVSMALMLVLARDRDVIVLPRDGYYNVRELAAQLRPHGAAPVQADFQDLAAVEAALRAAPGGAVLWAETPANPLLQVADIRALAGLAAAAGAPLVVDNTVATGLLQRPLDLGATVSLCSLTKSASGHSDVILGAALTRDPEVAAGLRRWRTLGGGIPGPAEAWLAIRGLRTLPLRIERQSENALAIARHLAAHPRVRAVHYPGVAEATLPLARAQMPRGFGPLLSFELDATGAGADAVIEAARIIVPATSFGGVESTWERRARWPGEQAPEALIRLSAGIEPAGELIADIEQAIGMLP